MLSAILWGGLAAASLLIGFYLSSRGLSNRTIGMVMGVGAGALLSAIAYELIPESLMGGCDDARGIRARRQAGWYSDSNGFFGRCSWLLWKSKGPYNKG